MLCSQGYVLLHLILNTDPMKVHLQFLIQWCDVNIHNYQYHQFHRGGGGEIAKYEGCPPSLQGMQKVMLD